MEADDTRHLVVREKSDAVEAMDVRHTVVRVKSEAVYAEDNSHIDDHRPYAEPEYKMGKSEQQQQQLRRLASEQEMRLRVKEELTPKSAQQGEPETEPDYERQEPELEQALRLKPGLVAKSGQRD